jgi:hypothetical protein
MVFNKMLTTLSASSAYVEDGCARAYALCRQCRRNDRLPLGQASVNLWSVLLRLAEGEAGIPLVQGSEQEIGETFRLEYEPAAVADDC